jgi:O-methyltransferase
VSTPDPLREHYLTLLKQALTRSQGPRYAPRRGWARAVAAPLQWALDRAELDIVHREDGAAVQAGRVWPAEAETMIGLPRLDNLQHCIEQAIADDVPGDVIECGVWRGGATIFARGVLMAHGVTDRTVWVADSFAGLPEPDARYPADAGDPHHTFDQLAIPRTQVEANFRKYGLLDEQVRFLEGWFSDTLPGAPIERLAVLRLDGDMYSSTIDALGALYDKLSPGGFVIVDDYSLPTCAAAVHDFRRDRGIEDPIVAIDAIGSYWRRSA